MCLVKVINAVVKHSSLTSAHTTQTAMHDIRNYKKKKRSREREKCFKPAWLKS